MTELILYLGKRLEYFRISKMILSLVLFSLLLFEKTRYLFIQSVADAYIAVTSFVALTLIIFYSLEKKKFNIQKFIENNRRFEIFICAFLGVIPGCGGAIMVMSLYTRGVVSFSSVLATLISTMGDAAFLLLASNPKAAMIILPITLLVGILTGYLSQPISYKIAPSIIKKNIEKLNLPLNKIPNLFYKIWLSCIIPAVFLGFVNAFNLNYEFLFLQIDLITLFAFFGGISCLFMWVFNPLTDIQMASINENSLRKTVDTTCFVTVWVITAFACFEIINLMTNGNMFNYLLFLGPFVPLAAILIGFIPGCGPQIMITSMYISGQIPLSAQLGNSISNDGDALFPALAISPKVAILATLYSAIPAIIVAYLWYYFV
ncbi:MAG: manganese transporter [Pelagibacteraceae bacterium]|nr:manganese transporter [Pelagibacteraceae bacterium]|tara:strand:- start:883 stop:2007 length:1125 start_codon:yes stop_codon:yes gene_type:complete